jgi:hypothetical protein
VPTHSTRGHHLLFFAPVAGWLVTWVAWLRHPGDDPDGKADLRGAVRWQGLGAAVVLLHGFLQGAVSVVEFIWQSGPSLGDPLDTLMPLAITGITWLNVGGGFIEWLFLGLWSVRAWRGRPYPLGLGLLGGTKPERPMG